MKSLPLCILTLSFFSGFGLWLCRATAVGVPSLDEMAGDWLPMKDVANPPDVHNFNRCWWSDAI